MKNECGEDKRKTANKEEQGWVEWQKGFDRSPASQAERKISRIHYMEQCCHTVTEKKLWAVIAKKTCSSNDTGSFMFIVKVKQDTGFLAERMLNVITGGSVIAR